MIPEFNHNNVIPPHLGNPTQPQEVSPYECSIVEFCEHFATNPERIEILKGFVNFRIQMIQNGVVKGYQWIDGSFSENIEESEGRTPNDIDVVTFSRGLTKDLFSIFEINFPEFISPSISKDKYKVDHYPVPYDLNPEFTVECTRYWCQLFSHNRNGVWKGMIKLPLYSTLEEDEKALSYLNSL
ncbi:MAG: hypothetical protein PHO63_06125 [Bacilli bacterium]|nr:hypothetical protein [Bacilli bacterium]